MFPKKFSNIFFEKTTYLLETWLKGFFSLGNRLHTGACGWSSTLALVLRTPLIFYALVKAARKNPCGNGQRRFNSFKKFHFFPPKPNSIAPIYSQDAKFILDDPLFNMMPLHDLEEALHHQLLHFSGNLMFRSCFILSSPSPAEQMDKLTKPEVAKTQSRLMTRKIIKYYKKLLLYNYQNALNNLTRS